MHKTFAEAKVFMQALLPALPSTLSCRVLIAPSFPLLGVMAEWAENSSLEIGAQNIHDCQQGAFTGEVSADLVKSVGASFTLIGHSERRQLFNEGGGLIHKKVKRALLSGLEPILCVGETLEERESGKTHEVLQKQLLEALEDFSSEEIAKIILAYEPVWAIGTGKHATPEIAEEAHLFCRTQIAKKWGEAVASKLPILYGGSVNAENVKALMQQKNIDGALIGGASLNPESFLHIIQHNQ